MLIVQVILEENPIMHVEDTTHTVVIKKDQMVKYMTMKTFQPQIKNLQNLIKQMNGLVLHGEQ